MTKYAKTSGCPYCAKDIKMDALRCKHCGGRLTPIVSRIHTERTPQASPGVLTQFFNSLLGIGSHP